jgi:hypothetical protein
MHPTTNLPALLVSVRPDGVLPSKEEQMIFPHQDVMVRER